ASQSTCDIYFIVKLPELIVAIMGAFLALVWAYACLGLVANLKTSFRLRTGYTRKLYHVLIFISAVFVQAFGGFWAVCVFGTMVSLVVAHAILSGPGTPLYEAIAREQDGRDRTYFIIVPYFATLIGGLASSIFFWTLGVVGYLVGGLGDAAGEPVGTRWGKHPFARPGSGPSRVSRTCQS